MKAWLAEVLPNFPMYAHMLGNFSVSHRRGHRVRRGRSVSTRWCSAARSKQIMFCGLWYDDEFVRTADGWRMTRRVETKCFQKIL